MKFSTERAALSADAKQISLSRGVVGRPTKIVPGVRLGRCLLLILFFIVLSARDSHAQLALPATGIINTIAGNGMSGIPGDGGPASSAWLNYPSSVAVDSLGNVYVATQNGVAANDGLVVRKITASTGIISTYAGGGTGGVSGNGGAASGASFGGSVSAMAFDAADNLYVSAACVVRKITLATGIISTVAGSGSSSYSGDGGPATSAGMCAGPIAIDLAGNLYIAALGQRVRKVNASTGIISTVAGTGARGYSGDGGAATGAVLFSPWGVAVDAHGNLFIADNHRIRRVDSNGIITTIAGNGLSNSIVDGGLAINAQTSAYFLATDSVGNLYLTDAYGIRKITASSGVISRLAGNGVQGYTGDGSTAINAELNVSSGLAVDLAGNVYVSDSGSNVVRVIGQPVPTTLTLNTVSPQIFPEASFPVSASSISNGAISFSVTSGPATISGANLTITGTGTVVVMASQVASGGYSSGTASTSFTVSAAPTVVTFSPIPTAVYKASPFTVSAASASPGAITYSVTSGPATISGSTVTLTGVGTVTLSASQVSSGSYAASTASTSFTSAPPVPTLVIGPMVPQVYGTPSFTVPSTNLPQNVSYGAISSSIVSGPATASGSTVTLTGTGKVTIIASQAASDPYAATTSKAISFTSVPISPLVLPGAGMVKTLAGNGINDVADGLAISGEVNYPTMGGVDSSGNVYFIDSNRVRKIVASTGAMGTVAGTGVVGALGSSGPAITTQFDVVSAMAVDGAGNMYIADEFNNRIVKVTAATGMISVPVGSNYTTRPVGVAVDSAGNLYFTQSGFAAVYKLAAGTNTITTVETNYGATALATDSAGNIYFFDSGNYRVRKITVSTGAITTVAGNGIANTGGDGGLAINAPLFYITGIAVDSAGNIYLSDEVGNSIRKVTASTGIISTIAGNGTCLSTSSDAAATAVSLCSPDGVAVDSFGNIFTVDTGIYKIRAVGPIKSAPAITWSTPSSVPYGTALSAIQLNATSTVAGSFSYSPALGTVLNAGNQALSTTFTPTDTIDYSPVTTQASIVVNQITPTLTFSTIPSATYGASPFTVNASSASTGAITYSVTSGPAMISGSTVTVTGAGTVVLSASQAATANYTAANASTSFAVTQVTPVLVLNVGPTPSSYGSPVTIRAALHANTCCNQFTGSITFLDNGVSLGSVPVLGGGGGPPSAIASMITSTLSAGTHAITATWGGDANYNAVTSNAITQTVTAEMTLVCSPSSILAGRTANCTATLAPGTTGSVAFYVDNAFWQNVNVGSNGVATATDGLGLAAASTTPHIVQAAYAGDANHATISQQASVLVSTNPTPNTTPLYSYYIQQNDGSSGYDATGNITAYNDSVNGKWLLGYDTLNRLTSSKQSFTGVADQFGCWSYDSFGNMGQQYTSNQQIAITRGLCVDAPGATTAKTYMNFTEGNNRVSSGGWRDGTGNFNSGTPSYDSAGNMYNDLHDTYLYDPDGHVCAVQSPSGITGYVYDAEGHRVAKGTRTSWNCDPTASDFHIISQYIIGPDGQEMTEVDGSGHWVHVNVSAGGEMIATYQNDGKGIHFQLTDWLGTRRMQTTYAGEPEDQCQSQPFGDGQVCTHPERYLASKHFTGKERDEESGLDDFGARYYDSNMSRWMSPDDPFVDQHVGDPQSWNLFAYVRNRPITAFDPTGEALRFVGKTAGARANELQGIRDSLVNNGDTNRLQINTERDANGKETGNYFLAINADPEKFGKEGKLESNLAEIVASHEIVDFTFTGNLDRDYSRIGGDRVFGPPSHPVVPGGGMTDEADITASGHIKTMIDPLHINAGLGLEAPNPTVAETISHELAHALGKLRGLLGDRSNQMAVDAENEARARGTTKKNDRGKRKSHLGDFPI